MERLASPRFLCWAAFLLSWADALAVALPPSPPKAIPTATTAAAATPLVVPPSDVSTVANGGVAVLPDFFSPDLMSRMRTDARQLQKRGAFRPDGLSNYAKGDSDAQGFDRSQDRQTFRGMGNGGQQSWYVDSLGDIDTRLEFDALLGGIRRQLATDLDRPTLVGEERRHEVTYNWYEPGARLGRHLDEHHEETKGPKGWRYPTRRSVTWLVYLNDGWTEEEGGALLCHPRSEDGRGKVVGGPIGADGGNIQVGWMDDRTPVYLDAFRESGRTALYSCRGGSGGKGGGSGSGDSERIYWSRRDFDVPAQPIEFDAFLPPDVRMRFEQISTVSKDPRFANANANAVNSAPPPAAADARDRTNLRVTPSGGTLVLFDSVTLPHSVLEVTGDRPRIAATGWFHEDSPFSFDAAT